MENNLEVSGRRHAGSDDANTHVLCEPCEGNDETENAEHYCTVCNEYLCVRCAKVHKKGKFTKQHVLLGRDEMPKRKLDVQLDSLCTKHDGKPVDYFCESHEELCCSICLNIGHRQCHVEYILDIDNKMETDGVYTALTDKIKDISSKLQETKHASEQNIGDIKSTLIQIMKDIKAFRSEINTALDLLETTITDDVKCIADCDISVMESVGTLCEDMKEKLNEISANLDYQKRYKQNQQLVIMTKTAQRTLKSYEKNLEEMCASTRKATFTHQTFQKEQRILEMIQSMDSIGKLESPNTQAERKVDDPKKMSPRKNVNKDRKQRTSSFIGDIDVRHSQDSKDCNITGAVLLDCNRLAVADENCASVKLIDINLGKIISHVNFLSSPWDIACIDQNQMVITVPSGKCLTILSVGKLLSIDRTLSVNGECRGIEYNNNNSTFIVSFTRPSPPNVKIYTKDGAFLSKISLDCNKMPLFIRPLYVTLSTDENMVHVSDYKQNSVTSLSMSGEVKKTIVGGGMREPSGMCVDGHDNIYIADPGSDKVNILLRKDVLTKTILTEQRPQNVVFCRQSKRLFVSHGILSSKRNCVSVYSLD